MKGEFFSRASVNSKFGQRDTVERVMPFSANETETTKETVERNNEGLYTLITKVVAAFCHNNSRKRGRGVRGWYPARATV